MFFHKTYHNILLHKLILLFALLLFTPLSQSYALDVSLEWDHPNPQQVSHYIVFWGLSSEDYSQESNEIYDTTCTITSLSEDIYYFAVKAYDDQGRGSEYSNEVSTVESVTTDDGNTEDGSGGSDCFIATAAYGTAMSSKVVILCRFRDKYLKPNILGRKFIALYERYSPYVADCIANNEYLKAGVRWALWPAIGVASIMVHTNVKQKNMKQASPL